MKKSLLLVVTALSGMVAWGQCLPTYNSQCTSGDYINSVTFNTISNLNTGCTSPSANNYQNYSALSTNVQQNTSYTISVQPGPTWGQYFVVYFDFNNDNDFDDANEFFDIGYANGGATISNTVLIPNGIPGGPTKMRVLCRYSTGALTAGQACATGLSFGECEDYTVNVASPLTEDAGIASFVSPTLPTCSFTDSVRVELFNYGTNALTSATINFTLNAGAPTTINWTGNIAPFGSEVVNLGLYPLASNDNLVAIASMPNGVAEDPAGAWNDFANIASLEAGLSGIKTIGGTTPDYATFADAVTAMNTFGLCGSVIFDVRDGVYNEQIDLSSANIATDATNNVTFRSENGDASLVTLSFAGTAVANNFVVRLDGADFFSFEDLTLENTGATYGQVLSVAAGADSNRFERCHLHSVTSNTTSTNTAVIYSPSGSIDNGNMFIDNIVEGGSYGAYWYGSGTTALEAGTVFDGNEFTGNYYYGLYLYYQDAPIVTKNHMVGESTYTGSRFALAMNYCDNGYVCEDNVIAGTPTSGWFYGLYVLNCDGTSAAHSSIANNMVQVGKDGSTSTFYGLYMSNDGYTDIYHNSVFVSSGGASSRAFYGTSGGANIMKNNMFVNYTAGYAAYLASNYTVVEADYNLYHSPGGILGYYGADQATLADWQAVSGYDANGYDADPMFHSTYDLHVCNDAVKALGTPLASITMDIDGQMRDAVAPDMGADEFSALSTNFLGADVEVCTGEMVMLSAGAPSDTVVWSTGATTNTIDASMPGTYIVDVISVCGTGTDTMIVSASALVYTDFVVADEVEFCAGDDVLLFSNGMYDTYAWTGGSTNDSLTVTAGGTYTLDVTDACGTGTQSVVITENDVPTASFTSTNSYVTGIFTNTSATSGTSTYLWDFGDNTTSTAMNPTHVYSMVGTYTVTLTVTNECGTNTTTGTITTSSVGIEEIEGLGTIAIYPNPSNGIFQLDVNFNESAELNLVVVNMLGEVVAVQDINAVNGFHSGVIDLSTSAPGVYFLKIISDNNAISTQVLVKK